eukprot:6904352-Pyramimonas_sp.AAC.1
MPGTAGTFINVRKRPERMARKSGQFGNVRIPDVPEFPDVRVFACVKGLNYLNQECGLAPM